MGGLFFALDGCKLPSNASRECSGTIGDLKRKKEKKVKRLLEEQVEADKEDDDDERSGKLSGILNREKQVERLQKRADRIEKFLRENDPVDFHNRWTDIF